MKITFKKMLELEKLLGGNPLNKLIEQVSSNNLPDYEFLIKVLSVVNNKSIDEMCEELDSKEMTITDLVEQVIEIFKQSGLLPEESESEAAPKW